MPQLRTPHSALRTRRRPSALRLWARRRPFAPGEIPPPAEQTPQPAPGAPAIDIHPGAPSLPSAQARPSASLTLILPLLLLSFAVTRGAEFKNQKSKFQNPPPISATAAIPSPALHPSAAANPSRHIQALTGTPTKTETPRGATPQRACRDCSDLRLCRLALLSPFVTPPKHRNTDSPKHRNTVSSLPSVPFVPCLPVVPFPIPRTRPP